MRTLFEPLLIHGRYDDEKLVSYKVQF